jgi:hypothetical protein
VPEVSQQRRDELAIQLMAMTRADRTAGRVSALGFFPFVCVSGVGWGDRLTVPRPGWNSVQEARREAITENRFIKNPSINGWVNKVLRDVDLFKQYTRRAWVNVTSEVFGLIDRLDVGNVGAFAETPSELEYCTLGFSIVVYMEFELSRISENILPSHICGLCDKTAKAAGGNISPLNLRSVSNKSSGGPPQSRCEDGQKDGAESGKWSVVRISEVSGASHQDLSVSPDPLEREGTFLVLLIRCILFVVGYAGLK